MSGRKQHYIPQSLLRRFGRTSKRRTVQVTVYSRDRGIFTTATSRIAAERDFYSEDAEPAEQKTLDDHITDFEYYLAKVLAALDTAPLDSQVYHADIAAVVAHLCVRQAHFRHTASSVTTDLLKEMQRLILDKDWMRTTLGLDGATFNEELQQEVVRLNRERNSTSCRWTLARISFQHLC
jgi:hypothetical protein